MYNIVEKWVNLKSFYLMSKLYYFNPENDLALAVDSPHFTPPRAAMELHDAGAALPAWVCNDGDSILCSNKDYDWLDKVGVFFKMSHLVKSWETYHIDSCRPWGWSKYTYYNLKSIGLNNKCLPSDRQLNELRDISHRRLTIKILDHCSKANLPYSIHKLPLEIKKIDLIEDLLHQGQHIYIKSPWSGSGRGIIDSMCAPSRQVIRLAQGVIKHQGSVLVEEGLDKIVDFAMLYSLADGKAQFNGYSYFYNSGYSTYSGNILLNDDGIVKELSRYVPTQWLTATRDVIGTALEKVIGTKYDGPIGVDMIIYRSESGYLIAPCIECNIRMTMGRVAHTLTRRYIHPDSVGELKIIKIRPNDATSIISETFNSEIRDKKLYRGSIALTPPVDNSFCFVMSSTPVSDGKDHEQVAP